MDYGNFKAKIYRKFGLVHIVIFQMLRGVDKTAVALCARTAVLNLDLVGPIGPRIENK